MIAFKIILILIFSVFINPSFGRKGFGPGDQEWGYVTVRPKAHMFWWLYYTTADVNSKYEEKPLIIWLQGGPGSSGTGYGNFEEIGPLDSNLKPRNHTWVKDYNVLFIDNPVGTGFSYVENITLLSQTNEQIAKDLMVLTRTFFKKFPRFAKTPTYILAESYGGKMSVEYANLWYQEQVRGDIKSNFKGMGLIDSFISANEKITSMAPYLYNLGFIDIDDYKRINEVAKRFVRATAAGKWVEATLIGYEIETVIQNVTYSVDRYNVIRKVKPNYPQGGHLNTFEPSTFLYSEELKQIMKMVKKALNLESVWGTQQSSVPNTLIEDSRKPAVHHVEKLLNETDIKVFILNGQLDLIINTPGTLSWIRKMKWKYADEWSNANRLPLVINDIIEGYFKGFGNFKFFWVNRSGHMIPADNPVAMEAILKDLIYN